LISVLFVDDEPILLETTKQSLEKKSGFSVDTALSAPEALEQLKTRRYDVIVSDYQMPEMDGIQFLKHLRSTGNTIPFIIFTGKGREEVVVDAYNAGADSYVVKGGDPKVLFTDLARQIEQVVSRRKMEWELRFTNMLLSTQQETSPDGILVVDEQRKIISFNKRFMDMWNIPAEVIASGSDERALQSVLFSLVDPVGFLDRVKWIYEHRHEKSNDEIVLNDGRVFDRYSAPMVGNNSKHYGRVWYFRDITKRKQAEAALVESLQEKELLLKEIHHRVKNNLQTISSLLYLQSLTTVNEEQVALLKDARSRVISIGLIHQKLYQSADIAHILFMDYIRDLLDFLEESYGVDPEKIHTLVEVNPPDLTMELDTGIPCGLIISELVTNALKYAFKDRPGGTIRIQMVQDEQHQNLLTVSDDGHGIPAGFDLTTMKSLGMTIVSSLTRQLDGTLEILRHPGTTVTIRFPAPAPHKTAPHETGKTPATDDELNIDKKIKSIRVHHG
jgi:two-component sensor histidine kinase/DNA-binding response OmpR family regulator